MLLAFWRRGCAEGNEEGREVFEQTLYEKVDWECEGGEQQDAVFDEGHHNQPVDQSGSSQHQLTIIYVLFLAEAIMASSLQSQLKMLITKDDFCGNLSTSYLESILECAYAVGSVAGLFWGWLSDRRGRRPVALMGVAGMSLCCIGMGFATDLLSCTFFRLLAGLTLPGHQNDQEERSIDVDCEKAAFLGEVHEDGQSSAVRVYDAEKPDPISICQILRAPSLVVLLASYSILSLHSATFDQLLPHLGHSSTRHGGMGIPCSVLGLVVTVVSLVAGTLILLTAPGAVARLGPLRSYRLLSMAFPAIYILTPLLAVFITCSPASTAFIAILSILIKKVLHGSAGVFVTLLMFNASPDAFSMGTIIGLMQFASLFKALAVAVSGASFFLSNDFSVVTTNGALWSALALFSVMGAALTWLVRDHPVVGQDFPVSILKWETCFDAAAAEPVEMV
ncbi:hypothetical protein GP486_007966 [Trichoglossum hirsutum]|uniref:Major facilitator superfamily (MFS) profile domain-containing protein n=1 Tax=Trichoglossum hirsutum TaxID=265104 RepID=A0A9P8IJ37_9PEZI|nr:hypothetical protein GP486_007966 [Trichoglossum hirsutum]